MTAASAPRGIQADEYFQKPLDFDRLLGAVRERARDRPVGGRVGAKAGLDVGKRLAPAQPPIPLASTPPTRPSHSQHLRQRIREYVRLERLPEMRIEAGGERVSARSADRYNAVRATAGRLPSGGGSARTRRTEPVAVFAGHRDVGEQHVGLPLRQDRHGLRARSAVRTDTPYISSIVATSSCVDASSSTASTRRPRSESGADRRLRGLGRHARWQPDRERPIPDPGRRSSPPPARRAPPRCAARWRAPGPVRRPRASSSSAWLNGLNMSGRKSAESPRRYRATMIPTSAVPPTRHVHASAGRRELHGVGEQVPEHLLQPRGIAGDR